MRLTFLAPTLDRPVGGAAVIYEFASAMAAHGHESHVVHLDIFGSVAESASEIDWFEFDEAVEHHFLGAGPYDSSMAPDADVFFGYSSEDAPSRIGLPAVFIQGYRMLNEADETAAFHAPCPKICVAKWLTDIGRDHGVPADQLLHVPLGIHHDVFRATAPLAGRDPVVSFCFNPHPQKGASLAVEALHAAREQIDGLEVVVFGSLEPDGALPEWMDFRHSPSERELVDEVYNRSSVFLMPSRVEGFGLPALEAMACGSALVTTDNGGSQDYAVHDRTALVSDPGDPEALATNLITLLTDEDRRLELADRGNRLAAEFTWDRSAARLEEYLESYVRDPARFGR